MSRQTRLVDVVSSLRGARKTITVGTGGDFATINEALQVASRYASDYTFDELRLTRPRVQIKLLSGFVMSEQVFVVGQDLGYISITSEDAEVPIDRAALTGGYGGLDQNWREGVFPAFTAMRGGCLPLINALFSMNTSGTGYGTVGVYIFDNARGTIGRHCGVKNAGWRGLYVDGADCYARYSIWDGAGYCDGIEGVKAGLRASNGARVMFRDASAKNCWDGARISLAWANLAYADFSGAGSLDVSAPGNGIVADGSVVIGAANNCDNAKGYGVQLRYGTVFSNEGGTGGGAGLSAQTCGLGAINVDEGSTMIANNSVLSAAGDAVYAMGGSRVVVNDATISSTAGNGVVAYEGSDVSCVDSTISAPATGKWGAKLFDSRLNAVRATITGASGSVQINDGAELIQASVRTLQKPTLVSALINQLNDINGKMVIAFNAITNAVNAIRVTNAATGGSPKIAAFGTDTDVSLDIAPQGAGVVAVRDGNNAQILSLTGVASAVNRVSLTNSATGQAVPIAVTGTDTNVNMNLVTRGTGVVQANGVPVVTTTGTQTLTNKTLTTPNVATLQDSNGNKALVLNPVASAVNYVRLDNAATAGAPSLIAAGTDTDVSLNIRPQGAGAVVIRDGNSAQILSLAGVASAVNRVTAANAATGGSPTLGATGTDTDVSMNLTTKGAGVVKANGNPIGVKVAVPASASAAGAPGQWACDANYHYTCTAANTWVRGAVATW